MNPTPDHLDDEVLSALLDGDTGTGAAVDETADAAAHLRACDRCAERQAELAAARETLAAAPVEPLDELARRRLVAAALEAAEATLTGEAPTGDAPTVAPTVAPIGRSGWARRHPAVIGSAAAVVLALLAGVPFVIDGSGGGERILTAQGPLKEEAAGTFLGNLGDLSDRDRLRLRLSGAGVSDTFGSAPREAAPSPAARALPASPLAGGAPRSGGLASTPPDAAPTAAPPPAPMSPVAGREAGRATSEVPEAQAADPGFAGDQSTRDRADTDACVAALLNGEARGGRLTRSGTGTYQGRPAIVAAFELSGGTVAFIADRSGCAVLDRFSV